MSTAGPFTSKEAFAAAIETAFDYEGPEFQSKMLDMYTKDTIITVNQNRMTWNEFLPHIMAIRARLATVKITPHHLLRDGNMFAAWHTAQGFGKDGTETRTQSMFVGELNADGKAIWLEEIVIPTLEADSKAAKAA